MAKDKTKPRADLDKRRQAAIKMQKEAAAKKRWRVIRNLLIALVIIGLATTGIVVTVQHVQAERRLLEFTGDPKVTQIKPPNATDNGLGLIVSPDTKLLDGYMTVDMHADYQDSSSVQVMQYYGQALYELAVAGNIKLVMHLHMTSDTTHNNHSAGRASIAAACADTVGFFGAYNQAIWANASYYIGNDTGGFSDVQMMSGLPESAGIVGADLSAFQKCYTDRAMSDFVTAMDTGNKTTPVPDSTYWSKGVTATPVMLVNNETVDVVSDMQNAEGNQAETETLLQMLAEYAAMADEEE